MYAIDKFFFLGAILGLVCNLAILLTVTSGFDSDSLILAVYVLNLGVLASCPYATIRAITGFPSYAQGLLPRLGCLGTALMSLLIIATTPIFPQILIIGSAMSALPMVLAWGVMKTWR